MDSPSVGSRLIDMDEDAEQAVDVMDRWFNSDVWEVICEDADQGDQDSIELMEEISNHLGSLTFHLKNESGHDRVQYEMSYFTKLCDDFGVA